MSDQHRDVLSPSCTPCELDLQLAAQGASSWDLKRRPAVHGVSQERDKNHQGSRKGGQKERLKDLVTFSTEETEVRYRGTDPAAFQGLFQPVFWDACRQSCEQGLGLGTPPGPG